MTDLGRLKISGFADEIDTDFEKQLQTVTALGMRYISIRSAYAKSIAEYTVEEVKEKLLPLLRRYGVGVSSIGSPIGKIDIGDENAMKRQKAQLRELCRIAKVLDCRYIRIFSFYMPEGEAPENYTEQVMQGLREFVEIAEESDVILLHENEKDIYGDTGERCRNIFETVRSRCLRGAYDFANFVQVGDDPAQCWNMLRPWTEYIHIKDAVRGSGINVVFGTGDGRVREILSRAICWENYRGFLTLEPHLVQFDALASLERNEAAVLRKNTAENGKEGYEMQYRALVEILTELDAIPYVDRDEKISFHYADKTAGKDSMECGEMNAQKSHDDQNRSIIRLGIIGVGNQGNAYASLLTGRGDNPGAKLPAKPEHVVLGALCDTDPARKEFCRKKYGDIPFYYNWKDMVMSGDVDAVITTVPHYLHPVIAIWCMEHGMNVLVEKPAGVYAKSVREMNACAAAHPEVTFGIMFNQRTNVLYQKIRAIIDSGELGEIRRSNWIINSWWRPDSYYRQSAWRATWGGEGGGVLVNQAPHQLDLWQWMCGIPTRVYAKCLTGCHRNIAVENDVTIVTEYANGATGCFITTTHDPVGTDRLEIDLDGGKIIVEDSKTARVLRFKLTEDAMNLAADSGDLTAILGSNSSGGKMYTEEVIEADSAWGSQHAAVMENFARHILFGEPLLAPGAEGINGVNLANAALYSSWIGREVDNPVDEDAYLKALNDHIREEGKFPEVG